MISMRTAKKIWCKSVNNLQRNEFSKWARSGFRTEPLYVNDAASSSSCIYMLFTCSVTRGSENVEQTLLTSISHYTESYLWIYTKSVLLYALVLSTVKFFCNRVATETVSLTTESSHITDINGNRLY